MIVKIFVVWLTTTLAAECVPQPCQSIYHKWSPVVCKCLPIVYLCDKDCGDGMGLHPDFACKCVKKALLTDLTTEDMRKMSKNSVCEELTPCKKRETWDKTICQCVKKICKEPLLPWNKCNLA